jgi:hypothetical protein
VGARPQAIEVAEFQLVVPHMVEAVRAVGESMKYPKLVPSKVMDVPLDVGALGETFCERSGESYVKMLTFVQTICAMVMAALNPDPEDLGVAQRREVMVFQVVVAHTVAPTAIVGVSAAAAKLTPFRVTLVPEVVAMLVGFK